MSPKRLSPCLEHGCPNIATARGRCDEHRKERERDRSRRRRAERKAGAPTYDSKRWREFRVAYLRSIGWRCEECGERPADTSKLHVHHIVELRDGGAQFESDNCICYCVSCHNAAHPDRETKPPKPPPEGERRVWGL